MVSYFDTKLKLHNSWLNQCILYCHCDQIYLYQSPLQGIWYNMVTNGMYTGLSWSLYGYYRVEVWCYSDMHERSTLVRWVAAAAHSGLLCLYHGCNNLTNQISCLEVNKSDIYLQMRYIILIYTFRQFMFTVDLNDCQWFIACIYRY